MAEDTEQLKRDIENTRHDLGRDVNALTEKVSPSAAVGRRVDRVRGGFGQLKENLMGSADSAGTTVSGAAGSAASSVSDAGSAVGDAVTSAPERARSQTRGAPLAAGLVAFAAGWMVAAALPASTKERELAHEAKDKAAGPVKEQATHLMQEAKDNLQEPAQEAVSHVRETAQEAVSTVTEDGREAAQHVADESKGSADSVKQAGSQH